MTDRVTVTQSDGVGIIQLTRPPLNIIDLTMQDQLVRAAEAVDSNDGIAAVVIHGGTTFAAGADVKEMATMSAEDVLNRSDGLQTGFNAIAAISKPVIAAVTGVALGGGCELALCADLRFCADDAILGQPEVTLGIMPGSGGTQRLPRLIGVPRAKDLILTGRKIGAAEAHAIGLVDRVVAADVVLVEATAWAAQFAGGPSTALRHAKKAIEDGTSLGLDAGLALERELFAPLFKTADRTIGMTHFVQKQTGSAQFKGH